MVSLDKIAIGNLITFLLLVVYLAIPLGTLFNAFSILRSSKAAFERVVAAVPSDCVDDSAGDEFRVLDVQSGVEFQNVSFRYPEQDRLIDDLSFSVPTGKTFALLGSSGIGKSTVFDLLLKFVAPQSGVVKIFGTDISKASNKSVREIIGISQQLPRPYGQSIRSYLSQANCQLSEEDYWNALRKVSLDSKISSLDNELDAQLGVRGSSFSGGELQRLALAFCLLRQAPLSILDEPTTGLDEATERLVMDNVLKEFEHSTCIIATHNKRLAELCDGYIELGKS